MQKVILQDKCFVSAKFGKLVTYLKLRFAYNKTTAGDIYGKRGGFLVRPEGFEPTTF